MARSQNRCEFAAPLKCAVCGKRGERDDLCVPVEDLGRFAHGVVVGGGYRATQETCG